MKAVFAMVSFILGVLVAPLLCAEQKISVGAYEVHYIGLNTAFLSPKVAQAYQIERSKNRGYLSISVLKTQANAMAKPVKATVAGTMTNLLGQSKSIHFRQISEPNAWYQIATFNFDRRDLYRIQLKVTPVGAPAFNVQFEQKFYAD